MRIQKNWRLPCVRGSRVQVSDASQVQLRKENCFWVQMQGISIEVRCFLKFCHPKCRRDVTRVRVMPVECDRGMKIASEYNCKQCKMFFKFYHPWIGVRCHSTANDASRVRMRKKNCIYRGYYTVARRYEFYVRVARTIWVRYCSCHENTKFISSRHRVMFFLLYGD